MEEYRTEEEQVEALKKWWDENGRSTLIVAVLAVAASLGWQGYGDYRIEQAEAASSVYDEMLEAFAPGEDGQVDETSRRTAEHLAGVLKTEHEGSTYSAFAAFMLAKSKVESGDLDAAEQELRWVLANAGGGEVGELAQIRLARVLAAKGEHSQALDILNAIEGDSFPNVVAGARGDVHLAMGDRELANSAYQEARVLSGQGSVAQNSASSLLDLQLEQLNPIPARDPGVDIAADADAGTMETPEVEGETE